MPVEICSCLVFQWFPETLYCFLVGRHVQELVASDVFSSAAAFGKERMAASLPREFV